MNLNSTSNFKALALTEESLRTAAPSIFAAGPMAGVSNRYTFVPTGQIVGELREQNWVPVAVEEQRIRNEARRGFQKHLIRFRSHSLDARGSLDLARHALLLRYDSLGSAPVEPDTLLKARRPEDEGTDLWRTMNRCQENLERGGVSGSPKPGHRSGLPGQTFWAARPAVGGYPGGRALKSAGSTLGRRISTCRT